MEGEDTGDHTNIISDTLLVNHLYTHILFNSGTARSFVNFEFVKKLASKPDEMDIQIYVTTPLGTVYHTDIIFGDCAVNVEGRTLPADLVQLEL